MANTERTQETRRECIASLVPSSLSSLWSEVGLRAIPRQLLSWNGCSVSLWCRTDLTWPSTSSAELETEYYDCSVSVGWENRAWRGCPRQRLNWNRINVIASFDGERNLTWLSSNGELETEDVIVVEDDLVINNQELTTFLSVYRYCWIISRNPPESDKRNWEVILVSGVHFSFQETGSF